MTNTDLLVELLQKLDSGAHRRHELNLYYRAEQPMAFLSADARAALDRKFGRVAANVCRLAVTSLAERLRISGITGDTEVWDLLLANDIDQLSAVAHREALTLGQSFAIVWADPDGKPRATIESAEQVVVKRDPVTREVVAAVKRVKTKTTSEAWLYLPEAVLHFSTNTPAAAAAAQWELAEETSNPLGMVPVVPLTNTDRLLDDDGRSEIEDLKPLVDGLNKSLADLAVAQEYTARPRRWATGIELTEQPRLDDDGEPVLDDDGEPVVDTVNPIPEGNRAMISENDQARFGQLDGANLAGFQTAVDIWIQMLMSVSALPAHFMGITSSNPATAEAIRASEASLTARAEARQLTFGRGWEQVARLLIAVRDAVDPASASVRIVWSDASTRSVAAEADAAVKLFTQNIISRETTLARLGFSEDEIAAELARIERDSRIGADLRLGRYVTDLATTSQN